MNGFLNLYKPKGVSSAYVLNAVKRSIRGEVVGHMGTLDPLASGVLPVAIGKSTRLFDYLLDKVDKDFAGYIKDKRKAKAQWSEFMKIKDTRFEWFDDYSREVNDINYKKINVLRSRDV